ncbi:FAD-dependent oxidoreductase [Cerasicoccus maritimus]|uniref:FAD-dependent oxidoreductase n=1 Tax=Cerasicoccus maritimus TaxID=490089 RepID=UPI0028528CB6|nr:FAD-dependent oxidoreductase [Cerasicoccus maritimus]
MPGNGKSSLVSAGIWSAERSNWRGGSCRISHRSLMRTGCTREIDRFLAAGHCISGDQLANSAYRVQASAMTMRQALEADGAIVARQ